MICDPMEITYEIAPNGRSITFRPCGVTSFHPQDVANKYCAYCGRFMDLVEMAREARGVSPYSPMRRAE